MNCEVSPSYLLSLIPPLVGTNFDYKLRNANDSKTVQEFLRNYNPFSSISCSRLKQTASRNKLLWKRSPLKKEKCSQGQQISSFNPSPAEPGYVLLLETV